VSKELDEATDTEISCDDMLSLRLNLFWCNTLCSEGVVVLVVLYPLELRFGGMGIARDS
jgi:hypothetical protein